MIIKSPKTVIPAVAAVLLLVIISVISTLQGKGCAPFRGGTGAACGKCLPHKKQSASNSEAYEKPEEWNIHISGGRFEDGFSTNIHHLEDINDARAWKPGERCSIALNVVIPRLP